ncbi:hypothetical protein A2U01_0110922, partial [Trifolium medium]|nr:hypothetical protein [Trifolium medium]
MLTRRAGKASGGRLWFWTLRKPTALDGATRAVLLA